MRMLNDRTPNKGSRFPKNLYGEKRATTGQHSSFPGEHGVSELRLGGKLISVEMQIDVVEKLQEHITFGLKMNPPSDVRGVLVGRIVEAAASTIIVDGYELARYVPESGLPAIAEDGRLADLVHYWNEQGGARRAIGVFRSQRGRWITLSQEDEKGIAGLFKLTPHLFLIVRSSQAGGETGTLFVRHGRKAGTAKSYGEFPFNASLLRSQEGSKTEHLIEPTEEPRASPATGLRSGPKWRSWFSVGATWGVTVMTMLWLMNAYDPLSRTQVDPAEKRILADSHSLGLKLDRAGNLLEIAWNQDSSPTRNAKLAALTINDGRLLKRINLNRTQIEAGHIYCAPQTSDLDIRMEVASFDGQQTSESVRMVSLVPANVAPDEH
jgi:hypothetical protein